MAPHSVAIEPPKRYRSLSRKILMQALRWPYCLKKKWIALKKTVAEKREAASKQHKRHESYKEARNAACELLHQEAVKLHEMFGGHILQWYKEDILQVARLKGEVRGASWWNAYLHAEAKRIKEDADASAVPLKAHELAASLKEKWNAMTQEEKVILTDPLLEDLQNHRESISHGQRNVDLESFSNARQCLLAMEKYIQFLVLHACTGTEMCRSMVNKQTSTTAELKTKLKELINGELCTRQNFLWAKFRSLSKLTRPEVDILLGARSTKTNYFRKMETEEWEKWRQDRQIGVTSVTHLPENSYAVDSAPSASSTSTSASGTTESMQDMQDIQDSSSTPPSIATPVPTPTTSIPSIFINMMGPGTMSVGPVRKHKQRSDAGKKQGPRMNKSSSLAATMTAA
ncbi:hypothetical protein C0992_008524 [Termitomyces sp. T32_za158]|nr:hypothetical protein C0992_008524 [Termitomyces sp. T32_za158]